VNYKIVKQLFRQLDDLNHTILIATLAEIFMGSYGPKEAFLSSSPLITVRFLREN